MKMTDPYETTPIGFQVRVEQKLRELQLGKQPARRSFRWVAAVAACVALICGTALSLEHFGVLHFFSERYERPIDSKAIAQPVAQSCDSELLNAIVRDAYWNGELLDISLNVYPKDADTAFYIETDVGADGENFDMIWWKDEILSLDAWRDGRRTIELQLPDVTADVPCELRSWDWIQDEVGETLLIELYANDMTQGATMNVTLCSRVLDSDEIETATLTATLPPMRKGDVTK